MGGNESFVVGFDRLGQPVGSRNRSNKGENGIDIERSPLTRFVVAHLDGTEESSPWNWLISVLHSNSILSICSMRRIR
ncbi:MAG: hypothetical protein V7L29_25950 [Nostoc sp.]|uniref:hypothetical protein n=1 Tax=Nostoc sp. TaxID=1180 RepID=UPI002FF9C810